MAWSVRVLAYLDPGEARRGIEPFGLWPPLVALLGLAGAAAIAGAVLGWRRTEVPHVAPAPERPWLDLLVAVVLGAGMYAAVGDWSARTNPHGVLLGMDGPSYLRTVIAVLTEQWGHYNTDKRVLHAWLAATLGDDPLATTQLLSRMAVAMLPPLGFLLARAVTGRVEAVLVGLLCALHPAPWAYATQSTNYALFFAVATGALAALTWALARPHPARWALAGAMAGLAFSTQEKAILTVGPALATGVPLALLGRHVPAKGLAVGLLVAGIAGAGVVVALDPPVDYTPFGSLVVNQREELHREMPWTWPEVRQPDPLHPTALPLPAALRGGELEAALAAVTTPPDGDVLRFRADRGTWSVAPKTSMAPLSERLRLNLLAFERDLGPLPRTSLLLGVIGLVGLALPGRARWLALVPAAALVSAWGPLSLKYNLRYFVHLLPVYALLGVVGLGRLSRLAVGPERAPRMIVAVGAGAFWLLFGHAQWTGSDVAWRAPAMAFPSPAALAHRPDDPGGNARATLEVSRWLGAQDYAGAIVDCAPNPVWLFRHTDARISPPDGEHACKAAIADPTPGVWLVASSHAEFRGPDTPHPEALVTSGRWRVVGGWDPHGGPIGPTTTRWSTSAVVVLEAAGVTNGGTGAPPARPTE